MNAASQRHSTGIAGLDEALGGGLVPGTLTVLLGATGIGKTHLGMHIAAEGIRQDGRRGVVFDMSVRGDSQAHAVYGQRMFDWQLCDFDAAWAVDLDRFFDDGEAADYLHVFDYRGKSPTAGELDFDAQRAWKAELVAKLNIAIAFLYGNFIRGTRRVVIDGVDPLDRASDSIQLELFEYLYHQVVRKDPEWVARDLFRQAYRRHAATVAAKRYDATAISCVLSCTSRESMLESLIERPLDEGDWLAQANTVIYLGKIRDGNQVGRGLYVAKHRGSAASERIIPFRIGATGIEIA